MPKLGILEEVIKSRDCLQSLGLVRKPNKDVRVCRDSRSLHKYIKREHYPIITLQIIFTQLEKSKITFSFRFLFCILTKHYFVLKVPNYVQYQLLLRYLDFYKKEKKKKITFLTFEGNC